MKLATAFGALWSYSSTSMSPSSVAMVARVMRLLLRGRASLTGSDGGGRGGARSGRGARDGRHGHRVEGLILRIAAVGHRVDRLDDVHARRDVPEHGIV